MSVVNDAKGGRMSSLVELVVEPELPSDGDDDDAYLEC